MRGRELLVGQVEGAKTVERSSRECLAVRHTVPLHVIIHSDAGLSGGKWFKTGKGRSIAVREGKERTARTGKPRKVASPWNLGEVYHS